jgi:hypothetical protein
VAKKLSLVNYPRKKMVSRKTSWNANFFFYFDRRQDDREGQTLERWNDQSKNNAPLTSTRAGINELNFLLNQSSGVLKQCLF